MTDTLSAAQTYTFLRKVMTDELNIVGYY
jgi:hypothetical protein